MIGNGYVIDNWGLLVALLMVSVAALVSELMCISIGKTLMWSAIRALVQLCVMGVIIGYVIRSNNPWLVFGVIAVMLVAAVQITLSRAKGIPKGLAGPVLLSLVITMLLMISLVGLTLFPIAGAPIWRRLFADAGFGTDDLDLDTLRRHTLALLDGGLGLG